MTSFNAQDAFLKTGKAKGKLVLVTAAPPVAASKGEGKTSCTLALLDALRLAGASACAVLRQPSMGISAAGAKGGASGVGNSALKEATWADFGLEGQMLRVGIYQNLLVSFGEKKGEGEGEILLPRTSCVPTKYLRKVQAGPYSESFVLTPTCEIEQIRVLSLSEEEAKKAVDEVSVAKCNGKYLRAKDLPIFASWPVLSPSFQISLLSTLRGSPVLMYCGPFANVSLGIPGLCALKLALSKYDWVLMEAGYGFDMGMQKYLEVASKKGCALPVGAVVVRRKESGEGPYEWRILQGERCLGNLGLFSLPLLNVFEGEERKAPSRGMALNPAKDEEKELLAVGKKFLSLLEGQRGMKKGAYKGSLPLISKISYICSAFYGVPLGRVKFTKAFKKAYLQAASQAKAEGADLKEFIVNVVKSPSTLTDDDFKKFSKRTITVRSISLNTGSKVANIRLTPAPTTFLPRVV